MTMATEEVTDENGHHFFSWEKTYVFIDGSNLYQSAQALDFDIDFQRLRTYFQKRCPNIMRMYYFTAIPPHTGRTTKNLVDWMGHNGYKCVVKSTKEFTSPSGERKLKGNMDIELAVEAMGLIKVMDHAIIFSGDGDFVPLIESLQRQGVRVTVVSTKQTPSPIASGELRKVADGFMDLVSIRSHICAQPNKDIMDTLRPKPAHTSSPNLVDA